MSKKPQNPLNEEDLSFWEEFSSNVKKIRQPQEKPTKQVQLKEVIPDVKMEEVYSGTVLETLDIDNINNIDGSTAKKFKKSEFRIEATLDLHGYTEDKAYDTVLGFVKSAYIQGKRCILIITGKGLNKEKEDDIFSNKGILKERVPQWLNSRELRPLILSFRHPEAKLGGSGALYILLKRKRD